MSHYGTLMFDVEDLCWPASDDIALDLAGILTRNQVQGTFFVVGEKARLWRSRGRTDVIASLAPHDVALHTNLHSIHPTVSEYLAPCGWEDGVAEAVDLMARALLHDQPASLVRREVYGPDAQPPSGAKPYLEWNELIAACEALAQFVTVNQRLPANLGTVADPIGIGAFGAAVASALLARDADEQPARVELVAGRQTPAIADTIANHVRAGIAGWPVHDPQIDPARILLHTAPVLDAATGAGPG